MKRLLCTIAVVFIFLSFTSSLYGQGSVRGVVQDQSGEPLIGATIVLAGTTQGTVTDFEGNYLLENVPSGEQKLQSSYTGYGQQEFTVIIKDGETTERNIVLIESAEILDEVVVIGYGVQKKKDLAGAISKVGSEELTAIPVPSFDAAIQGKASGVQIITGSGNAGAGSVIRIRGVGSVSAGGEPLFVIDGVPMTNDPFLVGGQGDRSAQQFNPLAAINPADIESIEILKDAGSAGIYGSRGGNGVVLITTKRGKKGQSNINFSSRVGIVEPAVVPQFLDRDEWLQARQEGWENDGNTGLVWLPNYSTADQSDAERAAAWDKALQNNTDWWDLLTHKGITQEYNLSFSRGGEKLNSYIGLGYNDQESYLIKNKYRRLSARVNLDYRPFDKLELNFSGNISRGLDDRIRNAWEGGLGAAMSTALPIYPVRNDDGTYFRYNSSANGGNPLLDVENQDWRVAENRYVGNLGINYSLTNDLRLTARFGTDYLDLVEDKFFPGPIFDLNNGLGSSERDFTEVFNYTGNVNLNYLGEIDDNNRINVLLGTEYQKSEITGSFLRYRGDRVVAPGYDEEYPDQIDLESTDEPQNFSFGSVFARVIYTLNNKYIFNVLTRADGSSKFGPNNRVGFFPAASFAWLISDENFMQSQRTISYMKFRISYGITGNAVGMPDYQWLRRYNALGSRTELYNGVQPIAISESGNEDLKWETVNNFDIGLETNFFNDRIITEVSYYNKTTQDALVELNGVNSNGLTSFWDNILKIKNQGVELSLTTQNLVGEFQWTTKLNVARQSNEVLDLGGLSPDAIGGGTNDTRILEGFPVGTNFLVRYHGVDPDDGSPIWLDRNGFKTKVFSADNRVPVGAVVPDVIGGLNNSFAYKGFNLDVHFVFTVGGNIYDNSGKRQLGILTDWMVREELADRWTPNNRDAYYPRLTVAEDGYEGLGNAWQYNSTMFLYDATYLRLRNLTLGYTFGKGFLNKSPFEALNISLTGMNLLTFSEFPLDPEIARDFEDPADRNLSPNITYLVAPQNRSYTVSLRATF